ncbi:amino acid transporter, partial [Trypanosoma cruzi]
MSRTNPVVPATSGSLPDDGDSPSHHSSHEMNGSERKRTGEDAVPEKLMPVSNEPPASDTILAKLKRCVIVVIPPGGILASAFNLASSSIGAGILGLPLAANSSGLVMALVYLAVITSLTIYSMYALGLAAQ